MKPEETNPPAQLDIGQGRAIEVSPTIVTRKGWSGRKGTLYSRSPISDYDWLVAWDGTNMLTHERSDDLHIEIPAEARIVERRPPARADRDTHAALPSKRPMNPGLALVPAAVSGRPRRY